MKQMLFRRGGWGEHILVPADEAAEEWLRKTKPSQLVLMTGRRPRNPMHHRKMMALLRIVLENQEYYQTIEHLLIAIKMATGHYDIYPMQDGNMVPSPRSISFEAMSQDEFEPFYDKALDFICEKVIPGMVKEDLQVEVLERIAG